MRITLATVTKFTHFKMIIKQRNGFIELPILALIAVSVLVSTGAGVVLYKMVKPTPAKKHAVISPVAPSSPTKTSATDPILVKEPEPEVLGSSKLEESKPEVLTPTQTPKTNVPTPKPAVNPTYTPPSTTTPKPQATPPPVVQQPITTTQPQPQQPKTYSIIPFGDVSSFPERERILWTDAYSEFLRTPNLKYMDHNQQNEYFENIIDKYYIQYKQELEAALQKGSEYLAKLQEEEALAQQQEQVIQQIEDKLAELRQTLDTIQNQPVAMNVINGKKQRAYQEWITNNQAIYSKILNSSNYANQLNTIKTIYGL